MTEVSKLFPKSWAADSSQRHETYMMFSISSVRRRHSGEKGHRWVVIQKAQTALFKVFMKNSWRVESLQILCRFRRCHRWQQKRIVTDHIYKMNILLCFTSNNSSEKHSRCFFSEGFYPAWNSRTIGIMELCRYKNIVSRIWLSLIKSARQREQDFEEMCFFTHIHVFFFHQQPRLKELLAPQAPPLFYAVLMPSL